MITVSATIQIDKQTLTAVIQALHPGQPFTPAQVMEMLVKAAIEEYGKPATKTTHVVDPSWRFGYDEMD